MQKKVASLIALLFIATLVLGACGQKGGKAIGVNDLAADPGAYKGQINLVGVVLHQDPANRIIVLIDEGEYATCGLNPCGSAGQIPIYLPTPDSKPLGDTPSNLTYKGNLPKVEATVFVLGAVTKGANGYMFEVQEIRQGSKVIVTRN